MAQTSPLRTPRPADNNAGSNPPKAAEPWLDITEYGGYIGPNHRAAATTCSIRASSKEASCASASDFANGNGILILGAGPAPVIATPQAPTVTPLFQTGSTTRNYCVADRDWAGGLTPCGAAGSTSTAPSSMALASYSISSWSWNQSTQTMTITTSSGHNMPTTASGIQSEPYGQVEIQAGSTGNNSCEGAYSLTGVPSSTTLQFQRNELTSNPNCSGGTLRIAPEVMLKWDSHYNYAIQSASCSGSAATIAISPGIFGPGGTAASTWVVPWNVKAVISGAFDSHYNGAWTISNFGTGGAAVRFNIGSCSGVTNVGVGGTLSIVPGKAVKNHLIYECTGSSCALPGNATNYSLVGVAQGNDGYFIDRGWGANPATVDAGDAPTTAPTSALNEYLDTTIASGGGTTTLALASAATTSVSSAKAWHDNVPNLLAACAALPANTSGTNSGHIVVPVASSVYNYFPIIANFDMTGALGQNPRNCGAVTIDFGPTTWLDGAILPGKSQNFQGGFGGTNCQASFYMMGPALSCFQGYSYPLVYFEPEQGSSNWFKDVVFNPTQNYQTGILIDEQMDGDGTVSLRFDNAHVDGGIHSIPVIDRAGFGQFWNFGGWGNAGGNFSESIGFLIQPLCGMPTYQSSPAPMPYILTTYNSYSFGVMKIDSCGISTGNFGSNVVFNNMLTEGPAGPAVKVNMLPYGLSGITFNQADYADFTGGAATPYFDLTNSNVGSAEFLYTSCANASQPLLQTNSANSYNGIHVKLSQNACSAGIGYPAGASVVFENLVNGLAIWNGTQLSLAGSGKLTAGQIANPSVAPTVTVSTTCTGHPAAGTYTYGVVAWDASSNVAAGTGGSTKVGPASAGVTLDGATQCAVISQPTLPSGTAYWGVVRVSGPSGAGNQVYAGNGSNGGNSFLPVSSFPTITDQVNFVAGREPVVNNSSLQLVTPSGVFGNVQGSTIGTIFNCSSTASPAACGSAPTGLVQVAAASMTLTVDTTAVTANSRFAFTYVTTGVGCSKPPTNIALLLPPYVSGIWPGKGFTITLPVAPVQNLACISFLIEN